MPPTVVDQPHVLLGLHVGVTRGTSCARTCGQSPGGRAARRASRRGTARGPARPGPRGAGRRSRGGRWAGVSVSNLIGSTGVAADGCVAGGGSAWTAAAAASDNAAATATDKRRADINELPKKWDGATPGGTRPSANSFSGMTAAGKGVAVTSTGGRRVWGRRSGSSGVPSDAGFLTDEDAERGDDGAGDGGEDRGGEGGRRRAGNGRRSG